jgi:hypothetical protein
MLLVALGSGAASISLINDWYDKRDDALAQKANRLAATSVSGFWVSLGPHILILLVFCVAWRERPALITVYLATWSCFIAYSMPPLRLKARGFSGVLMDAIGSSMLPCILAVFLADSYPRAEQKMALWTGAVALWSLMFGMRGIVWHQIADWENDHKAETQTYAVKNGPRRAGQLTRYAIVPLEFIGLVFIIVLLNSIQVYFAIFVLGAFTTMKALRFASFPALVVWRDRTYFFPHDFYLVLFPLAILINLVSLDLAPCWVLAIHFVVFLSTHLTFLRELSRIIHH